MGERGPRWAVVAPPIVFESEDLVDSFSEFILNAHEEIQAKSGCFEFSLSTGARESAHGKISCVVESAFVGYFGIGPRERFEDVFDQAAYVASHLALDHVFADGNKRTALVIALALPTLRGVTLDYFDSSNAALNDPYTWIQRVVSREYSETELAEKLRSWACAGGPSSR